MWVYLTVLAATVFVVGTTLLGDAALRRTSSGLRQRGWLGSAASIWVWAIWLMALAAGLIAEHRDGWWYPWSDDWTLIPYLTGKQPVTLAWLWAQYNEHRIPIPKLLFLAEYHVSGGDFRTGVYLNILLLAALAAILLIVIRALRGERAFADAVLPLAVLSLGQGGTEWAFQGQFVTSTFLCGMFAALAAVYGLRMPRGAIMGAGLAALLLPMCGANGLVLAAPLALALGAAGLWRWRSAARIAADDPGAEKNTGVLMIGWAFAVLIVCAAWFIGYVHVERPHAGVIGTAVGALQLSASSLGPRASKVWPVSAAFMLILIVFSGIFCWKQLCRRLEGRWANGHDSGALGLAAVLAANGVLALAIGFGRGGMNLLNVYNHYASLSQPILFCCLLAWFAFFRKSSAASSLAIAFVIVPVMVLDVAYLVRHVAPPVRVSAEQQFRSDLRAGVPSELLADRYIGLLCYEDTPDTRKMVAVGIDDLRSAGAEQYQTQAAAADDEPRSGGAR